MFKLTWATGEYEAGVDRGIFFGPNGVEAWNGLISVEENTPELWSRVAYRDGRKIVNRRAEDSFSATVSCYTYPDDLTIPRMTFGMSYRVTTAKGYQIHLVYNAAAHWGSRTYTQNDATPFSVDIVTRPTAIYTEEPEKMAPSAHLIIDTTVAYPPVLAAFEDLLYGAENVEPRLPSPTEVFDIFDVNSLFKITDNGDGTFTMEAPDEVFAWLSETELEADWPRSPIFISDDTYVLRSW